MVVVAWVIVGILVALGVGQAILVAVYVRALLQISGNPDRSYQPVAAVFLCLRGADPSLPKVLEGIAAQSYSQFELFCVVDHSSDPAISVVEHFCSNSGWNVNLVVAENPPNTCSLKCHALVVAIQKLEKRFEVVALVDADSVPDPNWLADLVEPLQEDRVVASTGNRWFVPPDRKPGSLIRYIWHAGASVQMYIYRIPWGGSLAIEADYARDSGLLDEWGQALFEDTMLSRHLAANGKKLAYVKRLLVPNRESSSIAGMRRWLGRQLLNTRLYHPKFPLAVVHCLTTSVALLAALFCFLIASASGSWSVALLILFGWIGYQAINVMMFVGIHRAAQHALVMRGLDDQLPKISLQFALAFLLTPAIYFSAMLVAMFVSKTRWRGIDYSINGPFDIQMTEYHPMAELIGESDESLSIEQ